MSLRYKFSYFKGMRFRIGAILSASILIIIIGILISSIRQDYSLNISEEIFFILLFVVVMIPFINAAFRRTIDLFEPIYLISIITCVYFVFVPYVLTRVESGYLFYGVNYRPYLIQSIIVTIFALLGFYSGYLYGRKNIRISSEKIKFRNSIIRRLVLIGILLITLISILWVFIGGFPLWALNIFDNRAEYGTWYEVSDVNLGYLYSARLAFIPLLLLWLAYRLNKYPSIIWVISYILIALLFLALGVRIAPITLFLATIIYFYLERRRRPRILTIISGFVFIFVFNGYIAFARLNRFVLTNIWVDSWNSFLEGNSIIFGLSMIMKIFPSLIPFQKGGIFLSELVLPIPRILWSGKPDNVLINYIKSSVPIHYSPPIFGGWYADFGIIGPIIIMFLWGLGCAYVYNAWYRNQKNPSSQVLLSLILATTLVIYTRVNAVGFNWIIWVIIPVLIIQFLASRDSNKIIRELK